MELLPIPVYNVMITDNGLMNYMTGDHVPLECKTSHHL